MLFTLLHSVDRSEWSLAVIEKPSDNSPTDPPRRLLVTGASGFVGQHLRPFLEASGAAVLTLTRDKVGGEAIPLTSDSSPEEWSSALAGVDSVVHLAAIAHQSNRPSRQNLRVVNVDWPVRLFEGAVRAGVRNFVFLSSIKVFGDRSLRPLRAQDPYGADDVYGQSKVEAELALQKSARQHQDIRLAILRPPLVYGPGVKANFRTLLGWAARGARGWPLPFGAADAPRSLISVQNLVEAIVASVGQAGVFHCADAEDLSVVEVFHKLGVPRSRLIPVPASIMRIGFGAINRGGYYHRLYAPLKLETVDSAVPGWKPRFSSDECLQQAMEACQQ